MNFPTSKKIIGANAVFKFSDSNGNLTLRDFFNHWDWTGWIKPQIDYMAGNRVGGNCIRLIGDVCGVFDGTFTQAAYNAKWGQFVSYCAGLGVAVYISLSDPNQIVQVGMTNAQFATISNSLLASLSQYTNIVGVDTLQEANSWGPVYGEADPAGRINDIYTRIKAGGTTLPLTVSNYLNLNTQGCKDFYAAISVSLDYLDFHLYPVIGGNYDSNNPIAITDFSYWRTTYPALDIFFGEFGTPQSATADTASNFDRSVWRVATQGDVKFRGGLAWAMNQQDPTSSNDWGLYDTSWAKRSRGFVMAQYTGGYLARAN
jgi:hypothetical protein